MALRPPQPVNKDAALVEKLAELDRRLNIQENASLQAAGIMYRGNGQNVTSGWSPIKVDTILSGSPDVCDVANSCYTVPYTGVYIVSGVIAVNFSSGGFLFIASILNTAGGELLRGGRQAVAAAPSPYNAVVSGLIPCTAGDKLQLWCWNGSGVEASLEIGNVENRLSACRVG